MLNLSCHNANVATGAKSGGDIDDDKRADNNPNNQIRNLGMDVL
jgi:hypothetical protein